VANGWTTTGLVFITAADERQTTRLVVRRHEHQRVSVLQSEVNRNLRRLVDQEPSEVVILSGDHIYKMDYSEMLAFHIDKCAMGTVAAIEVDRKVASSFGIMEVDDDWRIVAFQEKPKAPKTMPAQWRVR
jgi:ADP-glucose pyrophosphorylase